MKMHKIIKCKEIVWVAAFTIRQQLKTRSFQIAFAILVCIAFLGPFLTAFFQGEKEGEKPETTTIEKIYVVEELENPLEIGYTELKEIPFYKNIKIVQLESGQKEQIQKVKDKLEHTKNNDVLLEIYEKDQFLIRIYKPRNSTLWEGEGNALQSEIEALLRQALEKKTNLSKEQKRILDSSIDTRVQVFGQDGIRRDLEEENGIAYGEYMCIYGFIFLLLMIGVYAGSMIASTVVSEKNGKVLEYLLTAVSPLNLLFGKVIGVFLLVIGEMLCVAGIAKISDFLAAGMTGAKKSVLAGFVPETILERFGILNGTLSVIFVILNLLFFGFLAAFAGTKASRIEELKDTMMIFSVGELVGGYLSMFCAIYMMEETEGILLDFAYLFPLSSSFLLPGAVLTGRADWRIVLVAILLLIICVAVLIWVTVKSYQEHLFFSKGKFKGRRGAKKWEG